MSRYTSGRIIHFPTPSILIPLLFVLFLVLHAVSESVCSNVEGDSNGACDAAIAEYERLSEQIQQQHQDKTSRTIVLASSSDSSVVRDQSYKNSGRHHALDLSNLTQILAVDPAARTVRVQAKATMEQLVQSTLSHGLIPAVVPEFKSITVAGAIVGAALESSSFRFGQFSDTVLECVVLLANGTLSTISEASHPDIFHALPGSYGSLGILMEATLQLVRPKMPRVTVTEGIQALVSMAQPEQQQQSHDFLDAIYFPSGELAVAVGDFTVDMEEKVDSTTNSQLEVNSSSLWFYEQIQDRLDLQENAVFTMPIYDYLFRWDYGAFWMARPLQFSWGALRREPHLAGPFLMASRPLRGLFGSLYSTSNLYRVMHKLHPTAVAEKFVIMDAYMPASRTAEYLKFLHTSIPTSIPIWLCPVLPPRQQQPLSPSGMSLQEEDKVLVNVAVWGRVGDNRGIEYVAAMEVKMLELGGRKMLYSQTNMTTETLYNQHVDGSLYDVLKRRLDPKGIFPKLHDKLQLTVQPPIDLKYWLSRLLL
ncbi:Delta(24)-sterol reductase [Seminavis robusta]|uniref:Delta(24)-sterol reductase n=1 Tax=Seminavis robusta TaxID=568900 RepID=A0A9N8HS93_9STRA|nr:Delta(24)-sterol reductase [Seminavis robusta]|eukprot:Sro1360_g266100.1 Delta(24)-sterol reductase (535) ;mRNA; f:18745-20349